MITMTIKEQELIASLPDRDKKYLERMRRVAREDCRELWVLVGNRKCSPPSTGWRSYNELLSHRSSWDKIKIERITWKHVGSARYLFAFQVA